MKKVIEMLGGIQRLIDKKDVVIIKPNLQWWNQGAPNIAGIGTLIDLIMNHPEGFTGEVVLIENVHRGARPWESENAGWKHEFIRNSDISGIDNYNAFCEMLKNKYDQRFSYRYLLDYEEGGKRVYTPEDGEGTVLCDGTRGVPLIVLDNGLSDNNGREVIMSYPIVKTDKGTIIDFKNSIWNNRKYINGGLKFINISGINHHSHFCGATGAVKNHLGISDLSGGPDPDINGKIIGKYFNFHSFPYNKWKNGPVSGMLGKEIGLFFKTIRKPDLNITTAEWIGINSRTELPVAHTRTIAASTDPVALDYHMMKYVLYQNSRDPLHDPDNTQGPVFHDLNECAEISGCCFDEHYVNVASYDLYADRKQEDEELIQIGKIEFPKGIRNRLKYLFSTAKA
ncbi:MAG: DUF362 domain-containing protein [Candidatus Latescibacteria bacterium]|nr:DUF362 domain-containing protein [Candidatus Latescibacterota bacterium]